MSRILVNFAHPALERSQINRALIDSVRDLPMVTINDLYEQYPDYLINVAREQALLTDHEIVLFQHPLYWYSSPSILKEWQDLVLTHRWAFGSEGTALQGKEWRQIVTTGGSEEVYCCEGQNRFTVSEFLRPFEATARLCNMTWQEPYVIYGTHELDPEAIKQAAKDYQAHILSLT